MAENNSSAPLKTAEGAATLWCVHVTGADDVHPMPSREVALEEANGLNISFCRIKRQDVDPVLIAVVAEWPHSADSHAAGLMIRDECLRMRATPALPATEYSSEGDLAEVQAEPVTVAPAFDASTSAGGRGFVAWYFENAIKRHDFRSYIREALAADFACALAKHLQAAPQAQPAFQQRVQPWMMECFGAEIAADRIERNHRFLEEALELVQATGCTQSEAHQLVDYVFGRPVGEPAQEVGGVMVTLAALCLANGLDMHQAGETELARVWTKVEAIRAKQAAKPKHSPLPQAQPADALDAETIKKAARYDWLRAQGKVMDGSGHPNYWRCMALLGGTFSGGESADDTIDAAMAAAQEGGNA